mmetsp:Transcript_41481/g.123940  ORF Transcript_41481/g.123940 Transcript_41481/m.123940 type:complete len:243 (-) Transcript_41481:818-1546(-)
MKTAYTCCKVCRLVCRLLRQCDHLTQMVFTFTNSIMPNMEHSRPRPEFLTPPNGRDGSERTKSLTKHIPASMSWVAMRWPLSRSSVKTAAPRPNSDWLARRMASASSCASVMASTGPKISSSKATMPGFTSVNTVGARKESPESPSGAGASTPPARSLAPASCVARIMPATSCLATLLTMGPKSTPYDLVASCSTTFCSKAAFTLFSTNTRLGEMQTWPVFRIRPVTTAFAAASRSASAKTT